MPPGVATREHLPARFNLQLNQSRDRSQVEYKRASTKTAISILRAISCRQQHLNVALSLQLLLLFLSSVYTWHILNFNT